MSEIMLNADKFASRPARRQKGVTLVVGLIFLAVLMILGVTAMKGTILEERMAGNARDRDIAMQSAEAALRAAEQQLGAGAPPIAPGTAFTPRLPNGSHQAYWRNTHPWGAQSQALTWTPTGAAAVPRYVIEEVTANHAFNSLTFAPVGNNKVYRVTARGVGMNPNTMIFLQANYLR